MSNPINSFPLLRLPHLVSNMIVQQFNLVETIQLSLRSHRYLSLLRIYKRREGTIKFRFAPIPSITVTSNTGYIFITIDSEGTRPATIIKVQGERVETETHRLNESATIVIRSSERLRMMEKMISHLGGFMVPNGVSVYYNLEKDIRESLVWRQFKKFSNFESKRSLSMEEMIFVMSKQFRDTVDLVGGVGILEKWVNGELEILTKKVTFRGKMEEKKFLDYCDGLGGVESEEQEDVKIIGIVMRDITNVEGKRATVAMVPDDKIFVVFW